jgi:transposase
MLTKMTEEDWEIVLEVFDAAQSERGEPGRDDRRFLEALLYFTVHSITWRALSAEFGKWNSIWKRFWRLSRSGVFEAYSWRRPARPRMWCSSSIARWYARTSPPQEQKGAGKSGAGAFAGWVLLEDAPQDRL